MLKGISPLLGPDLLFLLASMGHGDEIVVADANFPAAANAQRLMRMDGHSATDVVRAILTILPLDDFTSAAAFRMAVVDDPRALPPVCAEFASLLNAAGYKGALETIERQAFYERARAAFAIVATGENRLYGNLILKKGVIRPH
jgi:L-fucose mutarotase